MKSCFDFGNCFVNVSLIYASSLVEQLASPKGLQKDTRKCKYLF